MAHAQSSRFSPDSQALLENIPGIYLLLDPALTIHAASSWTAEWAGRPLDEVVGQSIDVLFPPASSHDLWARYRATHREQRAASFDYFHPEQERWMAHHVTPSPEGLHVFAFDITQQKQDARQLRVFETLLSSMADFAYLFDLQGRFTYVNQALLDLWGLDLAEAVGKNFKELGYPPELVELHGEQLEHVIATRQPLRAGNAYTNSDGQTGYYEYIFTPVLDDEGQVVAITGVTRDVTEQRRAEEAHEQLLSVLTAERARLQAILDQMPSGLALAEAPSGRLVLHNRAATRLLGHSPIASENYEGYARYGAVHADDTPYRPEEYPLARALLHGEVVSQEEMRYRRGDGSLTFFSVNSAPIRDEHGTIMAAVSIFQDISEQKRAAEALEQAHEQTTDILESITDAFYALDWDWCFTYVNRKAEALWGKNRDTLIGKRIWDELPQLVGSEPYERALQAARERQPAEFETRSPVLGRWIDVSLYPGTQGMAVYFRDVTERKEMEEQLRRSEEHYRLLFESNPHAMWVYDAETLTFVDVNHAALAEFGYTREEFLRMTIFEIRPEDERERLRAAVNQTRRQAFDRFGSWRLRKKDGSLIEAEIQSHAIMLEGRAARLAVVQDVTERNQVARENRRRRRELETLLELSLQLTRRLDLAGLCQTVADATLRSLHHAEEASLWLRDEDRNVLHTCAWSGPAVDSHAEITVPVDDGLLSQVLHGDKLRVVNIPVDMPQLRLSNHPEFRGIRTALAVPLLADHKALGVLLAGSSSPDGIFEDREQRLLQSIAAQAAIAIQNAMLFEELREISRRLLHTEEVERRRIAHELHDEVGAMLTSLQLNLRMNPARDAAARRELEEAETTVTQLLEQIRQLSLTLRPSLLDDLGVVAALLWLFDRYESSTHIHVQFQRNFLPETRFPPEIETAVYRIVQEALTNVARHAGVDTVQVLLFQEPGTLVLHVIDEGRGFDPAKRTESIGLSGMRERATLLGGSLLIDSAPGEGTRITGRLPTS